MRPDTDHQAEAETQADIDQPCGVGGRALSCLCSSLGTGKSEPEEHDGANKLTEHG